MMKHSKTQLFSTIGLRHDLVTPMCKRARLHLCNRCNCKCEFCYNKNDLTSIRAIDDIKAEIDQLYAHGLSEFDLTGGEPTTYPHLFETIDYIVSKGCAVSTLSNGIKFADYRFCEACKEHGLNEILFSVHGSNEQVHDSVVGRKGAFSKLMRSIENAQKLGFLIRFNCTVYDNNYGCLNEYAQLVNALHPFEVNFILMNYFNDNVGYNKSLNLGVLSEHIKRCIDNIDKSILINVRYVPYCYFQGYERCITGYYQLIYDVYDWYVALYKFQPCELPKNATNEDMLNLCMQSAQTNRCAHFVKFDACKKCKFFFICDGIKLGMQDNPVKPIYDEYITDINYYRKDFYSFKH